MSKLVDIEVVYLNQTEKAWLIAAHEEASPVWIPKSQCELEDSVEGHFHGMIYTLTLSQGLAEEKSLV